MRSDREVADPVPDGRQVGGRVAVAAVGLADDQRHRLALAAGVAVEEDAQRAVADGRQALGLELVADLGELVVVRRLAGQVLVGQGDPERGVDAVEVLLGEVDQLVPEPQRVGVAGLELDHPCPGLGREVGVALELGVRGGVERVGVGDQQPGFGGVLAHDQQVLDQHPERRTPVADVVLPDDAVAEVLQGADERVADDGGAQVADVHLLGHVGSRVVDGDGLAFLGGYAEAAVEARHLRGDPLGAQPDVDETGTADLRLSGDAVEVEVLDDPLGDVSRLVAEHLGQREGRVGLEVGELARPDDGVGVGVLSAESLLEGALEPLGQHAHRTRHACQAIGGSSSADADRMRRRVLAPAGGWARQLSPR